MDYCESYRDNKIKEKLEYPKLRMIRVLTGTPVGTDCNDALT